MCNEFATRLARCKFAYLYKTKNEYVREKLGVSRNTAGKYLNELEKIGILTSEQVGKEKIYKNNYLYDLMKDW